MIKRISYIKDMATFGNFDWNSTVKEKGNVIEFNKLNILYGRNYSGKTTLSRIFKSFELGVLPSKYENAKFKIITDNGEFTEANLTGHSYEFRVFNKDFVDENLSFKEGQVAPFAVIGQTNTITEGKIKELKKELGDDDSKTGLKHQYNLHKIAERDIIDLYNKYKNAYDAKLTNNAREIKNTNPLLEVSTYNSIKLLDDINKVIQATYVEPTKEELESFEKLVNEKNAPNVIADISTKLKDYSDLLNRVNDVLVRKIEPTKAITELLHDSALQEWVKKGREFHEGKRDVCAFCGNLFDTESLWKKLDAHFSKESAEFEVLIDEIISEVERELAVLNDVQMPQKSQFLPSLAKNHDLILSNFEDKKKLVLIEYQKIVEQLSNRKKDIFKELAQIEETEGYKDYQEAIKSFNELITTHNNNIATFNADKKNAIEKLRLNLAHQVVKTTGVLDDKKNYQEKQLELDKKRVELNDYDDKIKAIKEQITALEASMSDEKGAVASVNDLLCLFFADNRIKLEPIDEKGTHFTIKRNNEEAHHLSEGETNIIALC